MSSSTPMNSAQRLGHATLLTRTSRSGSSMGNRKPEILANMEWFRNLLARLVSRYQLNGKILRQSPAVWPVSRLRRGLGVEHRGSLSTRQTDISSLLDIEPRTGGARNRCRPGGAVVAKCGNCVSGVGTRGFRLGRSSIEARFSSAGKNLMRAEALPSPTITEARNTVSGSISKMDFAVLM
jgi:hypothetical protein